MEFEAKCNLAELERLAVEDLRRQGFDLAPGAEPHFNADECVLYLPFVRMVQASTTNHLNLDQTEAVETVQLAALKDTSTSATGRVVTQKAKSTKQVKPKTGDANTTKTTTHTTIEEDQARLEGLGPDVKLLAGRARNAELLASLSDDEQAQVREWWRTEARLLKKVRRAKKTQPAMVNSEKTDAVNIPQLPPESFTSDGLLNTREIAQATNEVVDGWQLAEELPVTAVAEVTEEVDVDYQQDSDDNKVLEVVAATASPF